MYIRLCVGTISLHLGPESQENVATTTKYTLQSNMLRHFLLSLNCHQRKTVVTNFFIDAAFLAINNIEHSYLPLLAVPLYHYFAFLPLQYIYEPL